MRTCEVPGCERKHSAKELFRYHYERKRVTGNVYGRPKPQPISLVRRAGPAEMISEDARRRGQTRRAIEDQEAKLRFHRMFDDRDW